MDDIIYDSLPVKVIHVVPLTISVTLLILLSVIILPINAILQWQRYIIEDKAYEIYDWARENNYYALTIRNFRWFTNKILVDDTNIELLYMLSKC